MGKTKSNKKGKRTYKAKNLIRNKVIVNINTKKSDLSPASKREMAEQKIASVLRPPEARYDHTGADLLREVMRNNQNTLEGILNNFRRTQNNTIDETLPLTMEEQMKRRELLNKQLDRLVATPQKPFLSPIPEGLTTPPPEQNTTSSMEATPEGNKKPSGAGRPPGTPNKPLRDWKDKQLRKNAEELERRGVPEEDNKYLQEIYRRRKAREGDYP